MPGTPIQALIDRGNLHAIQLRVVALCALVTLVEGIDLTLIPLLAPTIAAAWKIEPAGMGIIFSTGAFGLIFGGLGVGWLADRIGRRGALMAAMVLMTLATVARRGFLPGAERQDQPEELTGSSGSVVPVIVMLVASIAVILPGGPAPVRDGAPSPPGPDRQGIPSDSCSAG